MIIVSIGSNKDFSNHTPEGVVYFVPDMLLSYNVYTCISSSMYYSEPIGGMSSNTTNFVNSVLVIVSYFSPYSLLSLFCYLENLYGRKRCLQQGYLSRTLDCDVVDYNGVCVNDAGLQLPHPRVSDRRFVLQPLFEIVPEWKHPQTGATVSHLLHPLLAQRVWRV